MDYNLTYWVQAESRLDAIEKAVGMLRTGIKLRGVVKAYQVSVGSWDVVLSVHEDV